MSTRYAQQKQKKIICTHWPEVVNEQSTKNRQEHYWNQGKPIYRYNNPAGTGTKPASFSGSQQNNTYSAKPGQQRHSNARFREISGYGVFRQ